MWQQILLQNVEPLSKVMLDVVFMVIEILYFEILENWHMYYVLVVSHDQCILAVNCICGDITC